MYQHYVENLPGVQISSCRFSFLYTVTVLLVRDHIILLAGFFCYHFRPVVKILLLDVESTLFPFNKIPLLGVEIHIIPLPSPASLLQKKDPELVDHKNPFMA